MEGKTKKKSKQVKNQSINWIYKKDHFANIKRDYFSRNSHNHTSYNISNKKIRHTEISKSRCNQ